MSRGLLLPPVAVALGANLGDPLATLQAVRPLLADELQRWWRQQQEPACAALRLRWSPLFRTAPVGGPADQPPYLNAAVVVDGGPAQAPADRPPLREGPQAAEPRVAAAPALAAQELLERLLDLERRFGRVRGERWGPRSLDLDLLWCGAVPLQRPGLCVPHPHLRERAFVLAPLVAIDPGLLVPAEVDGQASPVRELLAALPAQALQPPPERLPGLEGWPE